MPEPVEPIPLTDREEAKWRAEFEKLGREAVRIAIIRGQGFSPNRKREVALLWLRDKEAAAERRERDTAWYAKWTWEAAFAVVVLTLISLLLAVGIIHL